MWFNSAALCQIAMMDIRLDTNILQLALGLAAVVVLSISLRYLTKDSISEESSPTLLCYDNKIEVNEDMDSYEFYVCYDPERIDMDRDDLPPDWIPVKSEYAKQYPPAWIVDRLPGK